LEDAEKWNRFRVESKAVKSRFFTAKIFSIKMRRIAIWIKTIKLLKIARNSVYSAVDMA
jgi:hypothetical protein